MKNIINTIKDMDKAELVAILLGILALVVLAVVVILAVNGIIPMGNASDASIADPASPLHQMLMH